MTFFLSLLLVQLHSDVFFQIINRFERSNRSGKSIISLWRNHFFHLLDGYPEGHFLIGKGFGTVIFGELQLELFFVALFYIIPSPMLCRDIGRSLAGWSSCAAAALLGVVVREGQA